MGKVTYDDDFRASAVLMLQAEGYPGQPGALSRVAVRLGVPDRTLRRWYKGEHNPPPDGVVRRKKLDLIAAIKDELRGILDAMPEARGTADYRAMAIAFGILVDKLQLLSGGETSREHIEVRVIYADELERESNADD